MKLLKNKKQYKNWAKEEGCYDQDPKPKGPVKYPCYAYTTVLSFGYEELNENYLYLDDVLIMAACLGLEFRKLK